jgi:hypothetical protein
MEDTKSSASTTKTSASELFLDETGKEWQKKYAPGKLRAKRLKIYTTMTGFTTA